MHGSHWIGIVHVDGNGLGAIFQSFRKYLPEKKSDGPSEFRHYIDSLRRFSIAIDRCTRKAARAGIDCVWRGGKKIPFIPIVLGGDDLTIVCDGAKAVDFTVAFLHAFEEETLADCEVMRITKAGLSACAGVAIVKPHFPFHRAYELAEGLIREAKRVKKIAAVSENPIQYSAFDFQVLFDTSGGDLEPIRARMTSHGQPDVRLAFRPYVVTESVKLHEVTDDDCKRWLSQHAYERLERASDAIKAKARDEEDNLRGGGLLLPRSQQHVLRAALHEGPAAADAALREIRHRYPAQQLWEALMPEHQSSLFQETKDVDGAGQPKVKRTYLIDAMDVVDLAGSALRAGDGR